MNSALQPVEAFGREAFASVRPRLGLDIGKVILGAETDRTKSIEESLRTAEGSSLYIPGAIEAIASIMEDGQFDALHLVSKCGPRVQHESMRYLRSTDFFDRTGISEAHVHFCLTRPEKGPIAEKLGITHFVDDRLDVLQLLPESVQTRLLFTADQETWFQRGISKNGSIRPVRGWHNVWWALKESIAK